MPVARERRARSITEIVWTAVWRILMGTIRMAERVRESIERRPSPLAHFGRTPGAYMTCMAMYGSGAVTGRGIIQVAAWSILQALVRALTGSAVAAVGATTLATVAPRIATGTLPATDGTTSASAFPSVQSARPACGTCLPQAGAGVSYQSASKWSGYGHKRSAPVAAQRARAFVSAGSISGALPPFGWTKFFLNNPPALKRRPMPAQGRQGPGSPVTARNGCRRGRRRSQPNVAAFIEISPSSPTTAELGLKNSESEENLGRIYVDRREAASLNSPPVARLPNFNKQLDRYHMNKTELVAEVQKVPWSRHLQRRR